jgi:hypothetical protein
MHGQQPPIEPYESTLAHPIPIYVKHPERMIKRIDLKIFAKKVVMDNLLLTN